jgi:DNA-binding CsgD family transcriptional regulator/tetratricopeptide (TPR) repeat protein
MVLLERERELAELDAALSQVETGAGSALAIEASAGLGKTRLLEHAREAADRAGMMVLSARATELERDFPFALVRQLFERPLAAIPEVERETLLEGSGAARGALGMNPRSDTHDAFAVLHGLYWVTAALAERKPLLLAVDDIHWADAGSLDYLGFLLPRLEELPVALVLASRPDEPEPPDGLGRVLADSLVRHLSPAPLSAEATTALLVQELGDQPEPAFASACHEVSGGNPFLLNELARALVEQGVEPRGSQAERVRKEVPERVAQTVLLRIARLSPEARAVARSLAVLGEDAELRLVAALAHLEAEPARRAADEMRNASILEPDASLRFIHPLVRNAVYMEIPAGERARAHAEAAAVMSDRGTDVERIATQLLASEPRGERQSVETLLAAGEQALLDGAPRSAIAYLTRAMAEPPPEEMRASVLDPLLTAGFRAADQSVLAAIEADIFREWEREPALRSSWAVELTMLMALGGRFDEAASMLQEAVEVAVEGGDMELVFQLKAQLNNLSLLMPATVDAERDYDATGIDPDSPAGRLAAAIEARSKATGNGTAQEAADAAKRALGNDGIIFAEAPELAAAPFAVMTLVAAEEMGAARRATECALAIARERDATPDLAQAHFLSGFVSWGNGELISAEADMRQAIDLARLAGIAPLVLMYTGPFMEILIERDELEMAERELQATGLVEGPVPESALFGFLLLIRAHLRFEQGRMDLAAKDFYALAAQAERMGFGAGPIASAGPYAVRALLAVGDGAQAREFVETMTAGARRWEAPATMAHVLRAAAAMSDGAEEIELLERASRTVARSPHRLIHAQVLFDFGSALRRAGRRSDARPPLRESFEIARRGGAARLARRAHEELEATGAKVRRYTPIGVESLTPSERRVAELAASGMTNRQIAQTLFVTLKTVEAHLSGTYHKLDIRSRRELPTALAKDPDA